MLTLLSTRHPKHHSSGGSSVEATKVSMGRLPPKQQDQTRERSDDLQKALEAEMVIFLREQNAQLMVVAPLLRHRHGSRLSCQEVGTGADVPKGPPSSYEMLQELLGS